MKGIRFFLNCLDFWGRILLSSIKTEINNILENSQPKEYTIVSVRKEITKICQNLEKEKENNRIKIIGKFRELAKKIGQESKNNLLFPNQIQRELENVQILRNQVSHHNTTQSTQEDVINMLFSYIQIYLWWQEASQSIKNWDGTEEEVIKEFEKLKIDDKIMEFKKFLKKAYIPIQLDYYSDILKF